MLLVHANWSQGFLHLWAEVAGKWTDPVPGAVRAGAPAPADSHSWAADSSVVRARIESLLRAGPAPANGLGETGDPGVGRSITESTLVLRLPSHAGVPLPSPTIAHAVGHAVSDPDSPLPTLAAFGVRTVAIGPPMVPAVLDALEDAAQHGVAPDGSANGTSGGTVVAVGESVRFFGAAVRLLRYLQANQRLVPMILQDPGGDLLGAWQPWLADEPTMERLRTLGASMPPVARAAVDAFAHEPWAILDDFLLRVCDAMCRRVFRREGLAEAIESRDPSADIHVAWLTGLLSDDTEILAGFAQRHELLKGVRAWIGGLEDRAAGAAWRLCLRLGEPIDLGELRDFQKPGEDIRWTLSFHLQSVERPQVYIDAPDIWLLSGSGVTIDGQRIDSPQELLLAELGRAARLYKPLEQALEASEPGELELSTAEAYRFLREVRPILLEQNIGAEVPQWWQSPTVRVGARLRVESDPLDLDDLPGVRPGPTRTLTHFGLNTLVNYQWQIAVGETALTLEQFQRLAAQHSPLIRLDGRWVEIRPEDVRAAIEFLGRNPGGQMEVGRALKLAYASDPRQTGLPILGMDATGWVATVFGDASSNQTLPFLDPPRTFIGTLRPYQVKGLSWLAFLDRLGLGACLADDMGLGKTIQLLALLAHERIAVGGEADAPSPRPDPTLLIVPMSVVGNWIHETRRFTPHLKILVHHGIQRLQGAELLGAARQSDVVITTYALAHRDRDQLSGVTWGRVVLDEAQNVKNPGAKQTQAIRSIPTPRRIALTGTPVENRLGELWSIMEFLNPGYLDTAGDFRRRFSVPIERYHDRHRAGQLRGLVQPFVLRRLKSDPNVIADLPEKVESREYCYLTPEQATLYQTCVSDMLTVADQAEGMQRRGIVLAGLIKLKQICNHPAHFLKEGGSGPGGEMPQDAVRSGKCFRLVEMLREVLDVGDQALVFTQFRQMGHILAGMIRHDLDREVLFLHGGSTSQQRQEMIAAFQKGDGSRPIFILSLKAGGLGLNLTAANHVFHFDRWWNPAVEAQATDRAYRIGQTRTVHVHKFVCSGTLEERIDQMIEQKTELAENVIGSGEAWLTELSTSQLRDLLTLRTEAIGDED